MVETITQNGTSPPSEVSPSNTQRSSSRHSAQEKPWNNKQNDTEERQHLSREISRRSSRRQPRWWKIRFFKGMIDDVKRRAPFYLSDWTDAWDYRVVPATVYMYFAKYVAQARMLKHLSLSDYFWSPRDNEFRQRHVDIANPQQQSKICLEPSQAHALQTTRRMNLLTYASQYPSSASFLSRHVREDRQLVRCERSAAS